MSAPHRETSRQCPVCADHAMRKLTPDGALTLDHCERCGGVWFDGGEAVVLGERRSREYEWPTVPPGDHGARCHDCGGAVGRDAERCAVCGHANVVDCPVCHTWMAVIVHRALRVDHCRQCRGFWFDAREISALRAAMSLDYQAGAAWAALMLASDSEDSHAASAATTRGRKGRPDVVALLRSPSDDDRRWLGRVAAELGADILVDLLLHALFSIFD